MFRWFETRIDAFPDDPPARPPESLFAFYAYFIRPVWPAFAILLLGPDPWDGLPELVLLLLLADVGVAAVGALIAGLAAEARGREVITSILLLPMLVPVVIAGASASEGLLTEAAKADDLGRWLGVLSLYDVVFVLVSIAVFDYLLED